MGLQMSRNIFASLHATQVLLGLPLVEYRPALARMAEVMRWYAHDPELPKDQLQAAQSALHELERRLENPTSRVAPI